ncbi:hypothetical protein RI367_005480 [Sorochytrium milnesiophthora]
MSKTTAIDPDVVEKLSQFRFRKSKKNAALILKIDMDNLLIQLDELLEDIALDDLASELPDNVPRYIVLSYEHKHADGRVSYPLILLHYSPTSAKPEMSMAYASSRTDVVKYSFAGKVFELRDAEDFSEKWLLERLAGKI